MNIILLLIPISLILLGLGIWAFFWAVNHSQFDDLDTPALTPISEEADPAGPADEDAAA